jgi:colicin import membrane protein
VETEQVTVTALATIEQLTPMQLFAPGALNPILERIKSEVRAIETDISTEDGRSAIKSLAYKIARTKTFIDDQRVKLVADEKKRLSVIDSEGRRVREELDALKEEVRAPLTEWEQAEAKRIREHETRILVMTDVGSSLFSSLESIDRASALLDQASGHNFQEFTKRASQAREKAALSLQEQKRQLLQAEADRVERERIRAEAEEKARVEREAKIAEDARLKAEAEAKRREEAQALAAKQREEEAARVAAEDKARLEREKKASEERLQKSLDDARAKAQRDKVAAQERERKAEADRIAAKEQAEFDAKERRRQAEEDRIAAKAKAEAERESAVADERKRQEDIRAAEEAQRDALAREKALREADQAHRQEVLRAAHAALLSQVPGLTSHWAMPALVAISDGLIPGVSINY